MPRFVVFAISELEVEAATAEEAARKVREVGMDVRGEPERLPEDAPRGVYRTEQGFLDRVR